MSTPRSTTPPENRTPAFGPMAGRRRGPMGHGPMAMMRGEKARDFKGTMRKLIQYLGSYRIAIAIVMLFAAAGLLLSVRALLGTRRP